VPSFLRRKSVLIAAAIVLAAGTEAIFIASHSEPALRAGSFEVSPRQLVFDARAAGRDGTVTQNVYLYNTTSETASFTLSSRAPWLVVGTGASASVPPKGNRTVQLIADPRGATGTQHDTLAVTSGGATTKVAISLLVAGAAPAERGAFQAIPSTVNLGETGSAAQIEVVNPAGAPLAWRASAADAWVSVSPPSGTLGAHGRAKLDLLVNRAGLAGGAHASSVRLTSAAGTARVAVIANVGDEPLLVLPVRTLNFGRARQGKKTLEFSISNGGRSRLTFDVSNDRFYVAVSGAHGTVAPAGRATVSVTFDHDHSYYGERDYFLHVTSNGGSGEVRVLGITDTVGPRGSHENMTFIHTHADGKQYRHARIDLRDEFGRVVSARVQYRTCTGIPPAAPACTPWALSEMRPYRGATWEADVPVERCPGTTGKYINWRVQAEDDLINHQFSPGSATEYVFVHCKPPSP
jgi:hypothetical protein